MRSPLITLPLLLGVSLLMVTPLQAQDAPSGKLRETTVEKPAEKPAEKTGEKKGEKTGEKSSEKSSENPDERPQAETKRDDWGFRWADHPSLRLGRGTRVDFRVRLQGDLTSSDANDDSDGADVDVARRRIGIDGEILNLFDYQVEREISDNTDPWRDVYINYKQFGFAEIQGGKFKIPFSLDENTSPTNLDFVYRSRIAALLAPGRDRGVMAHGRVLNRGVLRYELGVFDADGSNVRTRNTERVHGDQTIAGRLVFQPFRATKSPARDLAFGVAMTWSDLPEGMSDLRGRTELDSTFYRPEIMVGGERRRIGLEARWRPGPFSIKSEYIRLTDERLGQSIENTDLSPFVSSGWYLSGTWAITGEAKVDGLDNPRRPLLRGGIGAVEVAARVERIRFGTLSSDPLASNSPRSEIILGNANRAVTFGLNWYPNRWLKVQANFVRNEVTFPDQAPQLLQPVFWSRLVRFQFSM